MLSLFDVYNRVLQRNSNLVFRGVLRTRPIPCDSRSRVILYTLLDKCNVNAYLLAAKSFLRYCPPVQVIVQSDGSLDEGSCVRLRRHLPGISIHGLQGTKEYLAGRLRGEVSVSLPPLGECCLFLPLKLLNPLYRFKGKYLILLDSDLLVLRRPDPVVEIVKAGGGRMFHTGGGNSLTPTFREMGFEFPKVDIARFSAGSFGFQNEGIERQLSSILCTIRDRSPALFSHWEIEQAIWAVLLNHCAGVPLNLSDLGECYVGNGWRSYAQLKHKAVFVHFVGATRFRNLMYPRLAHSVIRELKRDGAQ